MPSVVAILNFSDPLSGIEALSEVAVVVDMIGCLHFLPIMIHGDFSIPIPIPNIR